MTRKLLTWGVLLPLFTLLSACGDAENEFTASPCYLVIDNQLHNDQTLAQAMNPAAPGIFCVIRKTLEGGANLFTFENNQNQHSKSPFNAIDTRRSMVIGFNNGLIVGFGNLNDPLVFYAFDRECPNCFAPNAVPVRSRPLSINDTGLARCAACQRQYNLNTGGNIVSGDKGKKLTRYRAATTGPLGVLSVN